MMIIVMMINADGDDDINSNDNEVDYIDNDGMKMISC